MISPTQVSAADQGSDVYRQMENFDTSATIHAKPITGLGFGHKFYRPVQLPDISKFFPFFEYIPHNSVLWIWIKAGIGGFVAMFFLFGAATRAGVRSTILLARGRSCALAFAAVAYVVMYFVFAYVDIAWDMRSMVCLAIAFAFCSDLIALPETHPVVSRGRPTTRVVRRGARRSAHRGIGGHRRRLTHDTATTTFGRATPAVGATGRRGRCCRGTAGSRRRTPSPRTARCCCSCRSRAPSGRPRR